MCYGSIGLDYYTYFTEKFDVSWYFELKMLMMQENLSTDNPFSMIFRPFF